MDTPSRQSYRRRKARLISAGHTYKSLALKLKVSEHTVKAAVRGERGVRAGSKANKVIRVIERLRHE